MPPQIVTFGCVLLILFLYWTDIKHERKQKKNSASIAIWIPLLWLIFSIRSIYSWFNPAPLGVMTDPLSTVEGNPVERITYFLLLIIGLYILYRRELDWKAFFRKNIWVVLYFSFGALSVIWSDYPFVSMKRLIKASGNVIMATIILTEKRPSEALGVILRRYAFLLLPISILFIKYYPHLGRSYNLAGEQMFTGVATNKNGLGQLSLISGMYFVWSLLTKTTKGRKIKQNSPWFMYLILIPMTVWLIYKAQSATSILCLVITLFLFLICRLPILIKKPGRVFILIFFIIIVYLVLEITVNFSEFIIVRMLNRDLSLTNRMLIWRWLLELADNPIIGVGYESFWLNSSKLDSFWAVYGRLNQAHNGYLETYLNLGLIGLAILLASLILGLYKVRKQLDKEYSFALLRLVLIFIVLIYNWTEASFHGMNNIWVMFFIGILDTTGIKRTEEIYNDGQKENVSEQKSV